MRTFQQENYNWMQPVNRNYTEKNQTNKHTNGMRLGKVKYLVVFVVAMNAVRPNSLNVCIRITNSNCSKMLFVNKPWQKATAVIPLHWIARKIVMSSDTCALFLFSFLGCENCCSFCRAVENTHSMHLKFFLYFTSIHFLLWCAAPCMCLWCNPSNLKWNIKCNYFILSYINLLWFLLNLNTLQISRDGAAMCWLLFYSDFVALHIQEWVWYGVCCTWIKKRRRNDNNSTKSGSSSSRETVFMQRHTISWSFVILISLWCERSFWEISESGAHGWCVSSRSLIPGRRKLYAFDFDTISFSKQTRQHFRDLLPRQIES